MLIYFTHYKTFLAHNTEMFTRRKIAQTKMCTVQNCEMCIFRFVQICDFCIWKNICAADLRILCTSVFRTFADLHICLLRICTFVNLCREVFSTCVHL